MRNVPDNIMNEPSLFQVSCKVLPLSSFDFLGVLSPFLLAIFHPLNVCLCDASVLF
jgi:hypothetical protein